MTDHELLELAAKAAGIAGEYCEFTKHPEGTLKTGIGNPRVFRWGDYLWNPLTDDGDALRLAVKLEIDIEVDYFTKTVTVLWYDKRGNPAGLLDTLSIFFGDGDPFAATRRAIVRAAAEIGKDMS